MSLNQLNKRSELVPDLLALSYEPKNVKLTKRNKSADVVDSTSGSQPIKLPGICSGADEYYQIQNERLQYEQSTRSSLASCGMEMTAHGKVKKIGKIVVKSPKPEYGTEEWCDREVEIATIQVIRKELQTVMRNELYANPNILPQHKSFDGLKLHIEKMNGINTASQFVYICVSPDTRALSQDLKELMDLCTKAVTKVWIGEWLLTFEQRGMIDTPEYGTGVHINFLFHKATTHVKKAPTDMAREIRNTFKNVIGDGCFSAVDYKYSNQPLTFLKYFAGGKDDHHNPEIIMSDDVWRKENGLHSFYAGNDSWNYYTQQLEPEYAAFYQGAYH